MELLAYLKTLLKVEDVREENRRAFKMHEYGRFEELEDAIRGVLDI